MREESQTVRARVPAALLWDLLADYDRVVRLGWARSSAERIEGDASCAVRWRAKTVWEGVPSTYTVCRRDAERPRTLTWTTRRRGAQSSVRFDLRPAGDEEVDVTVTLALAHNVATRALEPFSWGLLRPAFLRTVEAIRHLDADTVR